MKRIWLCASAVLALAAAPGIVSADGWYGSAGTGYSIGGSVDIDSPINPTGPGQSPYVIGKGAKGDGGWGGNIAIGYAFENGFRVETALGKGNAGFKDNGNTSTVGNIGVWTAMVNGLYDFNRDGTVNPFLGAGVGMARVKMLAGSFDGANSASPLLALSRTSSVAVDDADTGFAWQLVAGLGLKLSERLSADVTYTYVNVADLTFDATGRVRTNAIGGSSTTPLTLGAGSGTSGLPGIGGIGIGLRYSFAPPPPPPPTIRTSYAIPARGVNVVPFAAVKVCVTYRKPLIITLLLGITPGLAARVGSGTVTDSGAETILVSLCTATVILCEPGNHRTLG